MHRGGLMRKIVQWLSAIIMNSNVSGFLNKTIYKGDLKSICVPGLNCYSCPGAIGSCPIGSLQAVIGQAKYKISFYVLGTIALFGVGMGRFLCGFLCPFGLLQDLLHKIPSRKFSTPKVFTYLKYVILVVFVILLPAFLVDNFGISTPYFCEYICPVGTLQGGIFLAAFNPLLRSMFGTLFIWKMLILIIVIVSSVFVYRIFCKFLCPLGALMALFNKYSFYQYNVDMDKCSSCNACSVACKMDVEIYKKPADLECIRCGECKPACPTQAITSGIKFK